MKYHIEKNTIQETLVIPLYARALCTRRFPHLFSDPLSVELLEQLDYDFSALERTSGSLMQTFGAMEAAMPLTLPLKMELCSLPPGCSITSEQNRCKPSARLWRSDFQVDGWYLTPPDRRQ